MKLLLASLVFLLTSYAQSFGWEESPKISELFKNAGVNGTFVLYDVTARKYVGHNQARSGLRFVPASTFKIPNTLIGLSVGAVESVDEVLPYKGPPQPYILAWSKDMGLREAMRLSNVPIFQELARRIGLDRMQENVVRMDYGNKEIGTSVDSFWLSGPLKISAVEQAFFLAKLAQGTLPFSPASQKSVREIALLEQGSNWKLYGKTGWQNAPGQGVGWWVGWVDKDGHIYAFALNIDVQKEGDAGKRLALGKASLKVLGITP
ncbi:MAG: class D beta-lactamase [Deltaproteobacteria bacterium]|nr:MAG: class D beta-lactamase [Deltaproteobacteria bacterium]